MITKKMPAKLIAAKKDGINYLLTFQVFALEDADGEQMRAQIGDEWMLTGPVK